MEPRSSVTAKYNSSHVDPEGRAHGASRCCAQGARARQAPNQATPSIQKLIDDMIETMEEYHGVGLAAPQVHEGLRLFVASLDDDDEDEDEDEPEPMALINPEITAGRTARSVEDWEGCLSIPDIRGRVPRAREIKVRALDRKGERIELRAAGFPGARHPARNRSSRRRAVLRPDEVVRVADLPRRVLPLLGQGQT